MKKNILKRQVLDIMAQHEEARNSDITLMTELWKKYNPEYVRKTSGGDFGVYFQDLHKLPTQDNIKRVRALIQNEEGRLLPTRYEVVKQRRISEEKWREYLQKNK